MQPFREAPFPRARSVISDGHMADMSAANSLAPCPAESEGKRDVKRDNRAELDRLPGKPIMKHFLEVSVCMCVFFLKPR